MPNNKSQKGFSHRYKSKGFTLIEVIVAAVLLALIAAGIFSVTLSSQKLINRSQRRHYANEVSKVVLENLRSYLGADHWYNASDPIHPDSDGGTSGNWKNWHYLSNSSDNYLNMYSLFGTTEFATKYNGKWRYKITAQISPYEYRRFEVEVDWTEPTP